MIVVLVLCGLLACAGAQGTLAGSTVRFDSTGTALLNGEPFFPIGVFTYSVDSAVMAELKRQRFNTIIAVTPDHRPEQLDFFRGEGMMVVAPARTNWLAQAPHHPALLAWYLEDEPEGHNHSPAEIRTRFDQLKALDPNHPIGLSHFLWEALGNYKDAAEFTMTSTYPLTSNYDTPITHVGLFMDRARSIHGQFWPHWPFIQVFGGPDTDGGRWRQPTAADVRCMVYIALVHRADGILYFSYWPRATNTWAEVGVLNRELQQMTPWLLARGEELQVTNSSPVVQVRAKQTAPDGASGILLCVNTSTNAAETRIRLPGLKPLKLELRGLTGGRAGYLTDGALDERLAPLAARVYFWGRDPKAKPRQTGDAIPRD